MGTAAKTSLKNKHLRNGDYLVVSLFLAFYNVRKLR